MAWIDFWGSAAAQGALRLPGRSFCELWVSCFLEPLFDLKENHVFGT